MNRHTKSFVLPYLGKHYQEEKATAHSLSQIQPQFEHHGNHWNKCRPYYDLSFKTSEIMKSLLKMCVREFLMHSKLRLFFLGLLNIITTD